MTVFSTTKLYLMLNQIQHISLSIRLFVSDNQINLFESRDRPKSGKTNYTIEPASPGNTCIHFCTQFDIYLVAFNRHGPCTIPINESISHSKLMNAIFL